MSSSLYFSLRTGKDQYTILAIRNRNSIVYQAFNDAFYHSYWGKMKELTESVIDVVKERIKLDQKTIKETYDNLEQRHEDILRANNSWEEKEAALDILNEDRRDAQHYIDEIADAMSFLDFMGEIIGTINFTSNATVYYGFEVEDFTDANTVNEGITNF